MFVGHFGAGLAMRGRARQVPVAAYVGGAFLLDFFWVTFAVAGIDLTPWSDWSHSLLMALVWATAFAAMFVKFGRQAVIAIWLIVFSHYVLDLLIQGASLWPYEPHSPSIPILVTAGSSLDVGGLHGHRHRELRSNALGQSPALITYSPLPPPLVLWTTGLYVLVRHRIRKGRVVRPRQTQR